EREQILYNHIRLGSQPRQYKSALKPYLDRIAQHPRFSPEVARRLGNPAFTRNLSIGPSSLERFVAEPMDLLQEIIRTLDADGRAAIALIFLKGGSLSSPVSISAEENRLVSLLGGSSAG